MHHKMVQLHCNFAVQNAQKEVLINNFVDCYNLSNDV